MPIILPRMSPGEIRALREELRYRLVPQWDAVREPESEYGSPVQGSPSPAAFHFLEVASGDWFRTMTEHYKVMKLRGDEGKKLAGELHRSGHLTVHPVKSFRPGGQPQIILPTALGLQVLRDANVKAGAVRGDGPHGDGADATHIYYQNRIARKLRTQGWTADIEAAISQKRVDVGAVRAKIRHAYEVVNEGLEKELKNLAADLGEGWQRVVFCVGNEDIQARLAGLITDEIGDQVLELVDFLLLPGFAV